MENRKLADIFDGRREIEACMIALNYWMNEGSKKASDFEKKAVEKLYDSLEALHMCW